MDLHKIDGRHGTHNTTEIMFLEFRRKIHDQPRFRVVYWNDGCFTKHVAKTRLLIVWQTNLLCLGLLGAGNVTKNGRFLGRRSLEFSMIWLRFVRCPFPSRCHGFGVKGHLCGKIGCGAEWRNPDEYHWGWWPPPKLNGGLTWFQQTDGIELNWRDAPNRRTCLKWVQSTTPR